MGTKKRDMSKLSVRDELRTSLVRRQANWRKDFHALLSSEVVAYKVSGDHETFVDRMNKNLGIAGYAVESVVAWAINVVGMEFDENLGVLDVPGEEVKGCPIRAEYRKSINLKEVTEITYWTFAPPKEAKEVKPMNLRAEVMKLLEKAQERERAAKAGKVDKFSAEDAIDHDDIVAIKQALLKEAPKAQAEAA